jgi:mycofactocin biosynthetic radical S-adenosylmethionine protein MftC
VWRDSELFADLRRPQTGGACASCQFYDSCQGGCMAAKFFTGLPLDGPDPECVRGFGEQALAARSGEVAIPRSDVDHSRSAPRNSRKPKVPVPLTLTVRPPARKPDRACDESPLAGFAPLV